MGAVSVPVVLDCGILLVSAIAYKLLVRALLAQHDTDSALAPPRLIDQWLTFFRYRMAQRS